jgi:hypothetical protein
MIKDILVLLFLWSFVEFGIIIKYWDCSNTEGFHFFNPIYNYKAWNKMNWFGVIFFTLLLNIVCPVFSLCYWFYKLCTVGRE